VGRQGCMFGRCNICVASSDNVSPFLLNANSAGRRKTRSKVSALRMSDMKKIKTKLVTFVTDNILLVGIIFLRACCKIRSGKAASREETKKVAMRQQ
jgi:hypothetical protein